MDQFWSEDLLKSLKKCRSFPCLSRKALRVLKKMQPGPVAMVCGPISTGGLGSIKKNLVALDREVDGLKALGKKVFEQHYLERHISRISNLPRYKNLDYILFLEKLYLPLFKSGLVHEMNFMPLWRTSVGTTWEHEQAEKLGIAIRDL